MKEVRVKEGDSDFDAMSLLMTSKSALENKIAEIDRRLEPLRKSLVIGTNYEGKSVRWLHERVNVFQSERSQLLVQINFLAQKILEFELSPEREAAV